MSHTDDIATSISSFAALLGVKPSIILPLAEVTRRVLNDANASIDEHNNKLKPDIDAASSKRDAAETESFRIHNELKDIAAQIKCKDAGIELMKQDIKHLREERDDTGDVSLTEQIKEKWKKIHEIEAEQNALHVKSGEVRKQLAAANALCLEAGEEYRKLVNKKQSVVQAILETIATATSGGFVTPDADTAVKPADFA